jgi:hypothetical protein
MSYITLDKVSPAGLAEAAGVGIYTRIGFAFTRFGAITEYMPPAVV